MAGEPRIKQQDDRQVPLREEAQGMILGEPAPASSAYEGVPAPESAVPPLSDAPLPATAAPTVEPLPVTAVPGAEVPSAAYPAAEPLPVGAYPLPANDPAAQVPGTDPAASTGPAYAANPAYGADSAAYAAAPPYGGAPVEASLPVEGLAAEPLPATDPAAYAADPAAAYAADPAAAYSADPAVYGADPAAYSADPATYAVDPAAAYAADPAVYGADPAAAYAADSAAAYAAAPVAAYDAAQPLPQDPQQAPIKVHTMTVRTGRLVCDIEIHDVKYRYTTPRLSAFANGQYPDLPHHACVNDLGNTFGYVMEKTSVAHLLEHVTISEQVRNQASGSATFVGTTEWIDEAAGLARIEVGFKDDLVALRAFNEATRFLNIAVLTCLA